MSEATDLIPVEQAAVFLGLSPVYIHWLVRRGEVVAHRLSEQEPWLISATSARKLAAKWQGPLQTAGQKRTTPLDNSGQVGCT